MADPTPAADTRGRTFPCESCGADLEFHIGVQTLRCPHCGFVKQLATDERTVSEQDLKATLERIRERRIAGTGGALEARACVLACGVGYGLPRQLGLELPSLFLHSAQLEVDAREGAAAIEIHLGRAVAPEGFGWTVPVMRGERPRIKVGVVTRGDAEERLVGDAVLAEDPDDGGPEALGDED